MSRWLWPWSNCVKERVCRYLLHHYLGHFFQEHLSLDQLSLDLYKGSVVLRDIHLEIWVRIQARALEGSDWGAQHPEAPCERVGLGDQAPEWRGLGRPALSRGQLIASRARSWTEGAPASASQEDRKSVV